MKVKERGGSSKVWLSLWLVILVMLSFIGIGCEDTSTTTNLTTSENEGYAEMKVYATVYGQVVDAVTYKPIAGLTVRLEGDQTYSATTDSNGYYRIKDVYLGTIEALNGGGSGGSGISTKTLSKTYPLFVEGGNHYATYKKQITLAVDYHISGSGSIVLESSTDFQQDIVELDPLVQNLEINVLMRGEPLANATVVLEPIEPGIVDRYEIPKLVKVTDSEGKVEITAADSIPATEGYLLYVYYESENGEWATGAMNCDLHVGGTYIDYDYVDQMTMQERPVYVELNDAAEDFAIVWTNINDLTNLPEGSQPTIYIVFSRRVDTATFSLVDKAGIPVGVDVETDDNICYKITPETSLSSTADPYSLYVYAKDALAQNELEVPFNGVITVYNPLATTFAAIAPEIDLSRLYEQDYTGYKVDWDEILVGDATEDIPYGSKTYEAPTFDISWPVVENATGYRLYVSNNDTWTQVDMNIFYNDGETIRARVTLPDEFDAWEGLDLQPNLADNVFAPWYNGQCIKLKILPENENGWVDVSQLNMNTPFLSLCDNWGPEIVASNTNIFGTYGAELNFDGVSYDSEVTIPFDEPVQLDNLTANPGDGEYGVTKVSGYFDISSVSWPDPDPEGELPVGFYLKVQLTPSSDPEATLTADASAGDTSISVNNTGPLAVGDTVHIGNDNYTVAGFCADQNLLYLETALTADVDSGAGVNLMGPAKGDADLEIATTGTYYTNRLVVNDGSSFNAGDFVLIGNQEINMVAASTATILVLQNDIANVYAGGTTVAVREITPRTTVNTDASAGATSLELVDVTDLDVGDFIAIGTWDNYYQITSVDNTTNTIEISPALRDDVAAGTVVAEYTEPASPVETTLKIGAPVIQVADTAGIVAQASLSIGDETATVKGVAGSYVAIDTLLTGAYVNANLTIDVSGVREPDVLQVKVRDMSGNLASSTDKDGDGNADYDEVDGNNNIF